MPVFHIPTYVAELIHLFPSQDRPDSLTFDNWPRTGRFQICWRTGYYKNLCLCWTVNLYVEMSQLDSHDRALNHSSSGLYDSHLSNSSLMIILDYNLPTMEGFSHEIQWTLNTTQKEPKTNPQKCIASKN